MEDTSGFLEKMLKGTPGTNAANFVQQLLKRNIEMAPDRENLGWVNSDEPNKIYLNSIYKDAEKGHVAGRALSTALHEMFHDQDNVNTRKIGELGSSDEAKHLLGNEMSRDKNGPWNPGYSVYNESLTRLRQDDMKLPQGESILNDPRVQKYIDAAFNNSRFNSAFHEGATRPQRRKDFVKALEMGLYPEQRWIEPREPTISERISDKIKEIFSK
jgi:hypothetical protein